MIISDSSKRGGKGMIKRIWNSDAMTVLLVIIVVVMSMLELD